MEKERKLTNKQTNGTDRERNRNRFGGLRMRGKREMWKLKVVLQTSSIQNTLNKTERRRRRNKAQSGNSTSNGKLGNSSGFEGFYTRRFTAFGQYANCSIPRISRPQLIFLDFLKAVILNTVTWLDLIDTQEIL